MSSHKKIICLLIISFITGCATTYAPDSWLPDTDDVPQNPYGGWITLITEPDTINPAEKWMQFSGEFISLDDNNVYLLYDSLYQVPKRKITNSTLELDAKSSTAYGLWVFGGSISTISHGYYAAITLPLWLIFGIPSAVGESVRDRYELDYPDQQYWDSVKVFARFPQGISDIDLTTIKPVFNLNESE